MLKVIFVLVSERAPPALKIFLEHRKESAAFAVLGCDSRLEAPFAIVVMLYGIPHQHIGLLTSL